MPKTKKIRTNKTDKVIAKAEYVITGFATTSYGATTSPTHIHVPIQIVPTIQAIRPHTLEGFLSIR